jgi:spore coat polysaccharide biosynthesis protein SpsF (cytidylyltransferase family)
MKNNPVAIVQARMGSSRLPGKVLREIAGKPMIWHVVQRVRAVDQNLKVLVAIPATPADVPLLAACEMAGIPCYTHKGDPDDVLTRYYAAATAACLARWGNVADPIIRVTGDCPLVDPGVIRELLAFYMVTWNWDIVGAELGPYNATPHVGGYSGFPDGLDVEIFSLAVLRRAWAEATEMRDREHVTPYIWTAETSRCDKVFQTKKIYNTTLPHDNTKLSVDTEDDFLRVQAIYDTHYKKPDAIFPASRFLEAYAHD